MRPKTGRCRKPATVTAGSLSTSTLAPCMPVYPLPTATAGSMVHRAPVKLFHDSSQDCTDVITEINQFEVVEIVEVPQPQDMEKAVDTAADIPVLGRRMVEVPATTSENVELHVPVIAEMMDHHQSAP